MGKKKAETKAEVVEAKPEGEAEELLYDEDGLPATHDEAGDLIYRPDGRTLEKKHFYSPDCSDIEGDGTAIRIRRKAGKVKFLEYMRDVYAQRAEEAKRGPDPAKNAEKAFDKTFEKVLDALTKRCNGDRAKAKKILEEKMSAKLGG